MPRSADLLGTYVGRPESPEAELLLQDAIADALSMLLARKGIYQKIDVLLDRLSSHLDSIKSTSLQTLSAEFSKRPWVPVSQDVIKENHARAEFFCGVGDSPLSASSDQLKLAFYLPSIKLHCTDCRDEHTFSSVTAMWWDGFANCYPRYGAKTEQIFNLTYNCVRCKNNPVSFLVKREGLRLTLCGRSERLSIEVPSVIPKSLRDVIRDAKSAAAENDIPAGFYHLRTFVEHYMKSCLGIPIIERISGEDLGMKYNASLDARMSSALPSMPLLYERTSKYMHERSGTGEEFNTLIESIEGHLSAKELFLRYGSGRET
jgi:hypothetical protein